MTGGGTILALALAAAPLPAGRESLGQYGRWAAFRDAAPARCYAIAEGQGGGGAYVTVASWPAAGARSQVQLRLRRSAAGPLVAGVAGARVPLVTRDHDAWPTDVRGDRRLAALLRGGGTLEVTGRDATGRRVRERYPLDGAASAIDAMRLACLSP